MLEDKIKESNDNKKLHPRKMVKSRKQLCCVVF